MTRTRRRTLLLLALGALVAMVLAEGGARLVEPALPEPLLHGDEATAVKALQLDARGPGCTDLVVAGNSMARDAFDPATFTGADPGRRRAYNAALDAASPELLESWLLDHVAPALDPDVVVLALASLDVNPNGSATTGSLAAYRDAPLTGEGAAGRLEALAVGSSALVRNREALRDPVRLAEALTRLRSGERPPRRSPAGIPGVIGPDGEGRSRRASAYRGDVGARLFAREQLLRDWSIDAAQLQSEGRLIRALRARGIAVVVVVLPVTADYVALHPGGDADHEAFVAAARRTSEDAGATFVDQHARYAGDDPATRFADTHHLNGAGAEEWSAEALPALLAAAGLDGRARCGS